MSQQSLNFESLVAALDGHWREQLAQLPTQLRERLARDLSGIVYDCWDSLTEDGRRKQAAWWDYDNNPELEKVRTNDWNMAVVDWLYWKQVPSLTAQEFCVLRHVHDPRDFDAERDGIPGGEGKTLGARVSDDLRIIERSLSAGEGKPIRDWIAWAMEQGWDVPGYLQVPDNADDVSLAHTTGPRPVTSRKIKVAFVIPRQPNNGAWWDQRMRDAKDYGLAGCRAARGRGRQASLWRPGEIAGWLVDKKHMTAEQVANILRKHFPDCADAADYLDPQRKG